MNPDMLAERARRPFRRPFWNSPFQHFWHVYTPVSCQLEALYWN